MTDNLYENMPMAALRQIAKEKGLVSPLPAKKAELIAVLNGAPQAAEKPAQPEAYACALAAGGLASALGYILWYVIVPRYSLTGASIIQLSVPLITAALAVIFLSEPVTLRLVLCAVPILGGICLALLSGKPQKRD